MIKKLPWKNIIIVFTALLVIPAMAYAFATSEDPSDINSNIKITSDEQNPDGVSSATSLLTSGALGYIEGATSATVITPNSNEVASGPDGVSSATTQTGSNGSINGYDDDDKYDQDDEEDDDDEEEDDD